MDRLGVGHRRAASAAPQLLELLVIDIAREDAAAIAEARGDRKRLAAGAGAQVDDEGLVGRAFDREVREQLAALVLYLECAALERREAEQVGSRVHVQRRVAPGAGRGRQLRGRELVAEGDPIAHEEIRTHGHRRALVEREREHLRLIAPVRDEPRGEPVGERGEQGDPCGRLALGGDGIVDRGDRVPVEVSLELRGARRLDQLLEHEEREQALEVLRRFGDLASPHERRIDAAQVAHEAIQRLADEPALVAADPGLLAERRGEAIGDEAPVHAGALPQLEDERAQPPAIGNNRGELVIRECFAHESAR